MSRMQPYLNNIALQRAINTSNCDEAQILIATGADVNFRLNPYLDTMLHKVKNAGIARDLLEYGADVNAKNLYKQTPLHSAVIEGKTKVVKTLLENLAHVNARDSKGFTPLYYAVKSKNVEAIKYLVISNAKINFHFDKWKHLKGPPILTIALLQDDLKSIKALIKYEALSRSNGFKNSIDLQPYCGMENFQLACTYQKHCEAQILRMKSEKMNHIITLFEMITLLFVPSHALYNDFKSVELFSIKLFEVLTGNDYNQYRDVIIEKLRSKLQVSSLKIMFCLIQISSICTDKKDPVTLNQDINFVLAKYLSKNDLLNLILSSIEPNY